MTLPQPNKSVESKYPLGTPPVVALGVSETANLERLREAKDIDIVM